MYQRFMYDHVKNYLHKHVFYWETGLERQIKVSGLIS